MSTGFIDWDSFSSPKKPTKSGFIDWDSFKEEEEPKKKSLINWDNIQSGQSIKIEEIDKPSVWDELTPVQQAVTGMISPLSSTGLFGKDVRDYTSALVQRGADASGGFVAGLGELAHDYLEKNDEPISDNKTMNMLFPGSRLSPKKIVNTLIPASNLLDEFDSGEIAGSEFKHYAREEMQNQVDRRMDRSIDQLAGDPKSMSIADQMIRANLEAGDKAVMFGAPMVTAMLTGGGLSTLAAKGLVGAGMAAVPKGLAGKEAIKYMARKMTLANTLGGMGEGALQGMGDRPSDPLTGGTIGTAFGLGASAIGVGLGKFMNTQVGKKALEGMKTWFDPSSIKTPEVLEGDSLYPPGATGQVIDVPEFDPKADSTGFDSGPFTVTRVDSEEGSLNLSNKPQGTYVSPVDNGVYEGYGFGNVKSKTTISPKNPLIINNNEDISAGTALLKNFFGESEADRIMRMSSDNIESEIMSKYPGIDLSKVRQKWDLFDIYGAQEARLRGHDYVVVNNKHAPDHSEGVILDDSIISGWERVSPDPIKVNLDDPASVSQARSLNDQGIPNEPSVSFDPKGPTSQKAAAQVPGTIAMMDDLDRIYAQETANIPDEPWRKIKKDVGGHVDKAIKTKTLGRIERAAHKIWGQLVSRGSIGGLRQNVSQTAMRAEFITDGGRSFAKTMSDEILAQPRVSKEIIQQGNNLLTDIEMKMADIAPAYNFSYQELNQLTHKAVSTRNYDMIPEEIRPQVQAYGTWMWNDLSKDLIRNGVREDIAKGMIYRNIDYLHQRYIGQNVDPDIWMQNRAIEDPESFKQTMSWYKQKTIEDLGKDVPKLADGSIDMETINRMSAARVRDLLTTGRISEKAPVPQKSATNSVDFDILKTTQGQYELIWTDYLTAGAAKIKAEAEAALGDTKFVVDPSGTTTEVPIFTRPEVDSMFDSYLENIPRGSANRIRNNYVNMILKRKGIDLPPGQKAEYLSVRDLVTETEKEFLFRQAIRQEDTPDFVVKFLGGHSTYIEAARDSLSLLAHDVSMVQMFHGMTAKGLETGAFSPVKVDDWEEITGASKLGLGTGFDALYAPPMTARLFNASVEAVDNMHWAYRLNNNLKAGKILSLPGVNRNAISAIWQGFFNGDVSPLNFHLLSDANAGHNAAVKSIFNGSGGMGSAAMRNPTSRQAIYSFFGTEFMEDPMFLKEMQGNIRRGITGGGSVQEMEEIAKIMSLQSAQIGDASGVLTQDAVQLISKIYQAPDIFIKTLAMRNRVRQLHWAETGNWSKNAIHEASEETLDKAAKSINDTYQSYELTPTLAKNLSRLPGGPSFITFPVESIRNFKNSGLESVEYFSKAYNAVAEGDLAKSGRYSALFLNKLAHMTAATAGLYAGANIINEKFGVTSKVKSALSDLINYKGNKGGIFITTDYDPEKHTIKYIDLSNANPYPHVASIVRLLDDTGKDMGQKYDELVSELGAIYAPIGIPIKTLIEASTGRSVRSLVDFGSSYRYDQSPNAPGSELLSDNPTVDQKQAGRRIYRFWRNLAPAVGTQAEAGVRGVSGDPIGSRSFSPAGEVMYQGTGLRENDVDLGKAYGYALREMKDKTSSLRSDWVSSARSIPIGDTKSMAELRKTKQAELDAIYNDAIYFASVARTLSFSDKQIDALLQAQDSRIFIKKFRSSIISGRPIRIQDLWNYEQD